MTPARWPAQSSGAASGDADALAARLRDFAAEPARFVAPPEAAPLDWAGHLAGVTRAYADARTLATTERGHH